MKSEKELLELLKTGDEKAIRIIFEEFYDGLCLYAGCFTKNLQVAEEVVEDVFIAIWINATRITINSSLKNYLYKSVYHGCLKYLKNNARIQSKESLINYETYDSYSDGDPESDMILMEIQQKAENILSSLPKQCREIYTLSRYEDLSYSQIAGKLKITVGTVKTQMSRAFQKFQKEFKEFLPLILALLTITAMVWATISQTI
jgi:RNA polymerase sigma-70 factor, ECF subfamily